MVTFIKDDQIMQQLFVTGMSFKSTPLAIREQFAVSAAEQESRASNLLQFGGLSEVVILWTCNRVEIYGVANATPNPEILMQHLICRPVHVGTELYLHQGEDVARHLFNVASGLDSMVLGETEITGQVKNAYEKARQSGHTGKLLNRLFQKALETAKEIRTQTAIGKGAASVGSVAVQHAQKIFGTTLRGRNVMIIGAGNMAEKCVRHLVKKGVSSISVVNRSLEKAELLASQINGKAVSFGRCLEAMADVDIVITSTGSPHIILEKADVEGVMAGRANHPLVIIDIAVPRDVAPEAREIPGVHLHDISHLESTVRENIQFREQDLDLCRSIIESKSAELESSIQSSMAAV
jgi:glutamyl-tRNA reductase